MPYQHLLLLLESIENRFSIISITEQYASLPLNRHDSQTEVLLIISLESVRRTNFVQRKNRTKAHDPEQIQQFKYVNRNLSSFRPSTRPAKRVQWESCW